MSEINVIEALKSVDGDYIIDTVLGETPRVIEAGQLYIYVPQGSTTEKGIVSFNDTYFEVENGVVNKVLLADTATADSDGNNIVDTYQTKIDNGLETNDKTVVGAINEIDTKIDTEVSNLVPVTRTIAGIDLSDDISVTELNNVLNIDVGKIDSISLGGKELPVDENKNVNIDCIDGSLIDDGTITESKLSDDLNNVIDNKVNIEDTVDIDDNTTITTITRDTPSNYDKENHYGVIIKAKNNNYNSWLSISPIGIKFKNSGGSVGYLISEEVVKSNYVSDVDIELDNETYVVTLTLYNGYNNVKKTQTIDLPLEQMITNVTYADGTLTFTLNNGTILDVPLEDMISGLVPSTRTISGLDLTDDITTDELWTTFSDKIVTIKPATTDTLGGIIVGDNLSIDEDGVLSSTDTTYTAGENIEISDDNTISATDTTYTAGTNVTISSDNVISATDTTYTAGDNIDITDGVISAIIGSTVTLTDNTDYYTLTIGE